MGEALQAALENGFERMGLNRVDALVYPDNKRSLQLLQKLGFQVEGTLRDYFFLDGTFYDHVLLALLRKDWICRQQPNPQPLPFREGQG
jgi:[ribosomal protein S5]-alanine N-acetyltransferase